MKLNRITTLKQLALFSPKLLELHGCLEGKWEPDLTAHEFLATLIDNFEETSFYFGQLAENGDIQYFAILLPEDEKKAHFWLFYVNKSYREETREILFELKEQMRSKGFTTVYTQSTRTSSSYERWLEKFGAEKVAIVYKFKL